MQTRGGIGIIEDDLELQYLYGMIIQSEGYHVSFTARTSDAAVERFEKCSPAPDVLIIDYRLIDSSGIDAAQKIRKIDPDIKIIFATADINIEKRLEDLNVSAILQKPFSMRDLIDAINGPAYPDLSIGQRSRYCYNTPFTV